MASLNVVVADNDCIISHIFCHSGIKMRREGIGIVEIPGCIVALKAVPGIHQNYIFPSYSGSDAVDIPGYGCKRSSGRVADIGRIKVLPVYIVGGQQLEFINPILGTGTGH